MNIYKKTVFICLFSFPSIFGFKENLLENDAARTKYGTLLAYFPTIKTALAAQGLTEADVNMSTDFKVYNGTFPEITFNVALKGKFSCARIPVQDLVEYHEDTYSCGEYSGKRRGTIKRRG